MNDLVFILLSLRSRWLNCLLSIFLTAFGLSIALLITQLGSHIEERLEKDGRGIDIVIGAKGSPLQLILSSVYHFDIPTGNIPYSDAKKIVNHPQIKSAIPLALGDNWKGFRIVGTSNNYLSHYDANLKKGRTWNKEYEVVIGSSIDLDVGSELIGSHGLLDQDNLHDNKYKVTGVLERTGTVLDRLILTSLDSVLKIHGMETTSHQNELHLKSHDGDHDHELETDAHVDEIHGEHEEHLHDSATPEITAYLVTTRSPVANINLPREINRDSSFQAANPAVEMARLTSMLGLGSKSFAILSFILIVIASLSIFSGLAANLENRISDLAVLRAIGYAKNRIFKIICLEGTIITILGIFFGILIGFQTFNLFVQIVSPLKITQASFSFSLNFVLLIFSVFSSGIIASIFPAYRASKISVAKQLSRNI